MGTVNPTQGDQQQSRLSRLQGERRSPLGVILISPHGILELVMIRVETENGKSWSSGPLQYSLPTILTKESISRKCYKDCLGSQAGASEVHWVRSSAGTVLLILG